MVGGPPIPEAPWGLWIPDPPASPISFDQPPVGISMPGVVIGPALPGSPWFDLSQHQEPVTIEGPLSPSPTPVRLPGISKPFLERVPDITTEKGRDRFRRFTEKLSTIVNSLLGQGVLVQLGANDFALYSGGRIETRAPTNTDDVRDGIAEGSIWVDTTAGHVYLNINNAVGAATWIQVGSGTAFTSPLTTKGDIYTHDATADARLPVGTNAQVLTADSTQTTGIKWATPYSDPLTTKGDILTRDGSSTVRLPVGTNGQVLTADSTQTDGIKWATPGAGSSPLTTKGDLYTFSTVDDRLPVGTDGQVLSADSTESTGLKWVAAGGSSTDPITSVYPTFTPSGDSVEFTGSDLAGFTLVNSGSHNPTNTETNNVLSILHPGSDANAELHGYVKTTTVNTNDYVEMAFRGFGRKQNFNICGVLFSDGSTYNASNTQVLFYYSPAELFVGLTSHTKFNTQGTFNSFNMEYEAPFEDAFLRLKYEGSNHWRGFASCDGISWADCTGQITLTMTPTVAGFFVTTWGGTQQFNWCIRYWKHSS